VWQADEAGDLLRLHGLHDGAGSVGHLGAGRGPFQGGAEGADHRVGAADGLLDGLAVGQLPGDDREMGVGESELGRGTDQGDDLVTVVQEPLDDEAADAAGRAEDGDTHQGPRLGGQ
jgi:hypothetical protein